MNVIESTADTHAFIRCCKGSRSDAHNRQGRQGTVNEFLHLGDNCFQNVHLGRYIVSYIVGNFVLWRHISGAVKCDFRPYN